MMNGHDQRIQEIRERLQSHRTFKADYPHGFDNLFEKHVADDVDYLLALMDAPMQVWYYKPAEQTPEKSEELRKMVQAMQGGRMQIIPEPSSTAAPANVQEMSALRICPPEDVIVGQLPVGPPGACWQPGDVIVGHSGAYYRLQETWANYDGTQWGRMQAVPAEQVVEQAVSSCQPSCPSGSAAPSSSCIASCPPDLTSLMATFGIAMAHGGAGDPNAQGDPGDEDDDDDDGMDTPDLETDVLPVCTCPPNHPLLTGHLAGCPYCRG